MSGRWAPVPEDLMHAEGVTVTALRVWEVVYLAQLEFSPDWDWSYSQIAREVGVSRRATVIDAVAWLCERGWLVKVEQPGDQPNLYLVCRAPGVPLGERSGTARRTPGGTARRTSGGTENRTHPVVVEKQETTNAALPLAGLPEQVERAAPGFEEVWIAWGRVGSKGDARKEYAAAIKKPGVSPAFLLDAVQRQRPMYDQRRAEGFNLAFERWLKKERWDQATEVVKPRVERKPYVPEASPW